MYYYDSRDRACKTPFGAVAEDTDITFNFYARVGIYVERVTLMYSRDGGEIECIPMTWAENKDGVSRFTAALKAGKPGLYWYYFNVVSESGDGDYYKGCDGKLSAESYEPYQITVYSKDYNTPEYIKGGCIYHIFADRFRKGEDKDVVFDKAGVLKQWDEPLTIADSDGVFRANDFYGGNFAGIIEKLGYLKSLGVTVIYLSPIFESSSNHRYDTGDYLKVDGLLGTEERFRELIVKAEKAGIRVMLDGVFNHTGADSRYFNKFGRYDSVGAYQSEDSPYRDWYYFSRYPDKYACWWGVTVVPTVNKGNKAYRELIFGKNGVIDKWTAMGVKGWRLDVVDELDSDFVTAIRSTVKSADKDAVVIGEVWEDASNKISYSERRAYFMGAQLDGVMNYPFKNAILSYVGDNRVCDFRNTVMDIVENYPKQALDCCMNFIDTHDTVRALNIFADIDVSGTTKEHRKKVRIDGSIRAAAVQKLKLATLLQYTLPGVPSIYYGDEVGLDGYEDPLNRRPFPWDDMDEELLGYYRKLGAIRGSYRDVFKGGIEFIPYDGLLVYTRSSKERYLKIVVNNGSSAAAFAVSRPCKDLLSDRTYNYGEIVLKPHSAALLTLSFAD